MHKQAVLDRWQKTRILDKIPDHQLGDLAVALENQLRYLSDSAISYADSRWARISVPLVRRILPRLNFQSNLGYSNGKVLVTEVVWDETISNPTSLDYEADWCLHAVEGIVRFVETTHWGCLYFKNLFIFNDKIAIQTGHIHKKGRTQKILERLYNLEG